MIRKGACLETRLGFGYSAEVLINAKERRCAGSGGPCQRRCICPILLTFHKERTLPYKGIKECSRELSDSVGNGQEV